MVELENKTDMFIPESGHFFTGQGMQGHLVHLYFAFICCIQGTENMQEGTLAGAGRAYDRHHFSPADLDIHAFQHFHCTIPFIYVFSADHSSNIANKRGLKKTAYPPFPAF
jgi:hypothetical protein